MKWVLLVFVGAVGSDGGATSQQVFFETKDLCETAAKVWNVVHGFRTYSFAACHQVKK